MLTQLNSLRDAIHANAIEKGFYDTLHTDTHYLALIIEEVGEAISAHRKGQRANTEAYQVAINTHHRPIEEAYATYIKGSLEEEVADICIRLLDFAGYCGADLTVYSSIILENKTEMVKRMEEYAEHFGEAGDFVTMSLFMLTMSLGFIDRNCTIRRKSAISGEIFYELNSCYNLAAVLNFDLLYHIQQKMAYNATRPRLHGKKY